jgi:hypothetical protein
MGAKKAKLKYRCFSLAPSLIQTQGYFLTLGPLFDLCEKSLRPLPTAPSRSRFGGARPAGRFVVSRFRLW